MRGKRYHALEMTILAALAIAAAGARRLRPFRVAVVGASMEPTLRRGDLLVAVLPATRTIRRGDLVVVPHPADRAYEMVKRVGGLPGDPIPGASGRRLEPGELWLEGDNSGATTDSRSFGPVSDRWVRGVVVLRYWPPGRVGIIKAPGPSARRRVRPPHRRAGPPEAATGPLLRLLRSPSVIRPRIEGGNGEPDRLGPR